MEGAQVLTRRIAHLQFGTDGGTERFMLRLAQAFARNGAEQVFALRPGQPIQPEAQRLGPVMTGKVLRRTPVGLWQAARMRRRIADWRPDVVMAWRAPAARLMPEGDCVKVVRLGDYPTHLRHFDGIDAIVANVPSVRDTCRALGWTGQLHLISNFPPAAMPEPVGRSLLGTPETATVVCAANRFAASKGMDSLVDAMTRVPDAFLWLVGDGPDRSALEAQVDRAGLRDRTRFAGWVTDPVPYLRAADICVVPSRREPLGNAMLDAWRAGVPVIATRFEGAVWVGRDRENLLFADLDAADQIAAAIAELEGDPVLGARLVEGGRRTLEDRFSEASVVSAYFELFDSLRGMR